MLQTSRNGDQTLFMDEFLLTGDRSGLGLISVYSHALFSVLCTRAVVLLLCVLWYYCACCGIIIIRGERGDPGNPGTRLFSC